jgi:hypothetical protein
MSQEQKEDPIHTIAWGLAEFFKNDPRKIVYWMCAKNPSLGDVSPCILISLGKTDKVAQFILAAMELNSADTREG